MGDRSEDIQLIRDFYLILIGVVISYFIEVTVNYNMIASPIVLLEWASGIVEPVDSIMRSLGVTIIPIASIFLYGFGWRAYERFLKDKETSGKAITLWKELPQILFFGITPIGFLELASPSIQLETHLGIQDVERFGGALISLSIIAVFVIRTRRFWRVKRVHSVTTT